MIFFLKKDNNIYDLCVRIMDQGGQKIISRTEKCYSTSFQFFFKCMILTVFNTTKAVV